MSSIREAYDQTGDRAVQDYRARGGPE